MKKLFQIYNDICLKYKDHNRLIDKLFSFLTLHPQIEDIMDDFLYKNLKINNHIDPINTIQLIGLIHQKKKEGDKIANTNERKHFGIYYTDYSIAKLIIEDALGFIEDKESLINKKFLEPCSGIGIFIIAYLDYIFENCKINNRNIQGIINNIYAADIDISAIALLKKIIPAYVRYKYIYNVNINNNNFYAGDLLFKITNDTITKNNPEEIFNINKKFDIVATNPPYKLLKANSNKYHNDGTNDYAYNVARIVNFIKKEKIYKYNQGTLNYYKIFVEEILEKYTHQNSVVGLLIPTTILNDKQSEKLRKHILENYCIPKIYIIPEKNYFFPDITQSFCFFGLNKTINGKYLTINPKVVSQEDFKNKSIKVSLNSIKQISDTSSVIIEEESGWKILNKISKNPKLKYISSIKNLRGELDLTLDKNFITKEKTDYPLLRGVNIGEFDYKIGKLFVDEKFIYKLNGKQKYLKTERLVCQQISNIHAKKRLKFTKIPANIVLGNSCNFISKESILLDDANISLDYLLGILNSLLLDWRFKVTNSNNHVSNYELNDLPIAIPNKKQKSIIENLVTKIRKTGDATYTNKLNSEIFNLYDLSQSEKNFILNKYKNSYAV